jgi:hypothetical protein
MAFSLSRHLNKGQPGSPPCTRQVRPLEPVFRIASRYFKLLPHFHQENCRRVRPDRPCPAFEGCAYVQGRVPDRGSASSSSTRGRTQLRPRERHAARPPEMQGRYVLNTFRLDAKLRRCGRPEHTPELGMPSSGDVADAYFLTTEIPYANAAVTLRLSDGLESCEWKAIVGFVDLPLRWDTLGPRRFPGLLRHRPPRCPTSGFHDPE